MFDAIILDEIDIRDIIAEKMNVTYNDVRIDISSDNVKIIVRKKEEIEK